MSVYGWKYSWGVKELLQIIALGIIYFIDENYILNFHFSYREGNFSVRYQA